MKLLDALLELDTGNDHHWTEDGLPSLETLGSMMDHVPTREEVTDAAPHFTRESPELPSSLELETALALEAQEEKVNAESRKLAAIRNKNDKVLVAKARSAEPEHIRNQKELQRHIDSQCELREARVARRNAVLKNLSPSDLKGSPLEEAMARKKNRNRPVRDPIVVGKG